MKTRGKILREPGASPGLLIIDGQQYKFSLDGIWNSETPPRAGLAVDVEMNPGLEIVGLSPAGEPSLDREEVEARLKTPDLIGVGLLAIGWLFFPTITIALPDAGSVIFTFWQILGLVNAGNVLEAIDRGLRPSAGIFGLVGLIALAGPFVYHFWRHKLAALGGLAPILFMTIAGAIARRNLLSAFAGAEFGGHAISLGLGAYLSVLMCVYFSASAIRRFLSSSATMATEDRAAMRREAA